jgi:hypothetical protein
LIILGVGDICPHHGIKAAFAEGSSYKAWHGSGQGQDSPVPYPRGIYVVHRVTIEEYCIDTSIEVLGIDFHGAGHNLPNGSPLFDRDDKAFLKEFREALPYSLRAHEPYVN